MSIAEKAAMATEMNSESPVMEDILSDLDNHHIEGYTAGGYVRIPLLSQILKDNRDGGELWVGGCIGGVRLPDEFDKVLSLYPWEQYTLGPKTERVEVRLYDSNEIPDPKQLHDLADLAIGWLSQGDQVLIHCQAGLNRSNLISSLVLQKWQGLSAKESIDMLQEFRSEMVLCNRTFQNWLLND